MGYFFLLKHPKIRTPGTNGFTNTFKNITTSQMCHTEIQDRKEKIL